MPSKRFTVAEGHALEAERTATPDDVVKPKIGGCKRDEVSPESSDGVPAADTITPQGEFDGLPKG